ncbi:MAG: efflux RND transporter periplasmic adaptor subunit [Acidobacteria bacterium]|nr:efflux RND transporter periplasmic adaptor subunit [Acidobacteriota bacterium]
MQGDVTGSGAATGLSRHRRTARWLLGILMLAGALAAYAYRQTRSESSYATVVVHEETLVHEIYATGTLNARVTIDVRSRIPGVVKIVDTDADRRVARGQRLALLDTDLLEAELAQAEATLESANALLEKSAVQLREAALGLERAQELASAGHLSRSELDAAEARYRSANAERSAQERQVAQYEAAVRRARLNLEHATLRSPIDGVVLSRNVEVGQTVNATPQPPTLFVLAADLAELQLDADVSEADVGHVAAGQPVRFSVDAYPGRLLTGVVKEVRLGPLLVQQAVYYRVTAAVENAAGQLRPGMTADVWIETARRARALLVPPTAIAVEAGRTCVEVMEGGHLRRRDIVRGLTNKDGRVEVLSGLAAGEQVLVAAKGV